MGKLTEFDVGDIIAINHDSPKTGMFPGTDLSSLRFVLLGNFGGCATMRVLNKNDNGVSSAPLILRVRPETAEKPIFILKYKAWEPLSSDDGKRSVNSILN